ncbi:hypothetical protein Pst134EA_002524 [Puccinia striiformis f. sp. tritici]|uniref:hypothetical protein n=1 Tax=Puccinia striiformis f. sp. tritici TaxID=168172 RepID=UPI002007D02E|nr:hypothetical protein Pst134EA_002524 [Puccinia striiformis f. sp. tritici]KAH9464113.1 hypothetical protein Pst134EB_003650 [Puccinia striiformis f. sp. tritici]KAH9471892.1 hypothetical protein Pst134EA_002524 [Puccinia striiformis f. sp. tritici]
MMDYYRKSSLPDQQHDKEETWVVAANLLDSMRASRAKVKDNADGGALKASRLGELGTNPVTDHNKESPQKTSCDDPERGHWLAVFCQMSSDELRMFLNIQDPVILGGSS